MIGDTLPKTHPLETNNSQNLGHKEYIEKMQKKENEE